MAGGGRTSGLYLDLHQSPAASFEYQADLSFLVVPIVEHTHTTT